MRRLVGTFDTLDAENAARAVLAGCATAEPETADGTVEMIRHLKVAHYAAVKGRSAEMVTLKAILVHALELMRTETARKTQIILAGHLSTLRPRELKTTGDTIRHTLRMLASRWRHLDTEARDFAAMIGDLVAQTAHPPPH